MGVLDISGKIAMGLDLQRECRVAVQDNFNLASSRSPYAEVDASLSDDFSSYG
jgi:hypothetical protein